MRVLFGVVARLASWNNIADDGFSTFFEWSKVIPSLWFGTTTEDTFLFTVIEKESLDLLGFFFSQIGSWRVRRQGNARSLRRQC